jgi:hypothetical protein
MNTKHLLLGACIIVLAGTTALHPAEATPISFSATGSGSDGPLSATVDFVTGAGSLTVTITNTLAASTIISAGQAVSDLSFTLSNAPGILGNVTATGTFATFNGSTTPTLTAGTPARWLGEGPPPPAGQGAFSIVGNTITLEAIGGGQPSELLLPAGTNYPNAVASITNGKFSPFVEGPAVFTFNLSGVTDATTITAASFSFGTGPDTFLQGLPVPGVRAVQIPAPSALSFFGAGLIGLGLLGWWKKKTPASA